MGRWHAHAAKRAGARVVGFVDSDLARAAKIAREFRSAAATRTLEDALAEAAVDVVHICTPAHTHEALATAAFRRGCHVLCEKPLAPTATVTERIYRVAREHGRLLCPVHQYAFQHGFQRALPLVADAGGLVHVDAVACSAGAEALPAEEKDRLVGEILPHPLSLLQVLLKELPNQWNAQRSGWGEWRIMGQAGEVGLGILLSASGRPTRNSLRLICREGTIHFDLYHGFAVREAGHVSRRRKAFRPFLVGAGFITAAGLNLARRGANQEWAFPGLMTLVARFYAAVGDHGLVPLDEAHALDVARARDLLLAQVQGPSSEL